MAQRLYRQRKETTIVKLEKRVTELKKTVQEMCQTFMDYNNKITSSGLIAPGFVFGFDPEQTARKFEQLTKKAMIEPNSDEEDLSVEQSRPEISSGESQTGSLNLSMAPVHTSSLMSTSTEYEANGSAGMLGYHVEYEMQNGQEMDGLETQDNAPSQVYPQRTTSDLRWDQGPLRQYRVEVPDQNLLPNLSKFSVGLPSYAFLESSFARRLHRSSYERAYHVLTNPSTPIEEIEKRMRLSFCFSDLQRIVRFLRHALSKSDREALDQWSAPLLHVGNAGLQYVQIRSWR